MLQSDALGRVFGPSAILSQYHQLAGRQNYRSVSILSTGMVQCNGHRRERVCVRSEQLLRGPRVMRRAAVVIISTLTLRGRPRRFQVLSFRLNLRCMVCRRGVYSITPY